MELIRPRVLRPGDCIGIVSTSSPVSPAELDRLTAYITDRGYAVKVADGLLDRWGYLAGTAERRAAGVMSMFADPDVALVLPVSGGTGANRLVDLLDYDLLRARPKIFDGIAALVIGTPAEWPAEDAPDADTDELILRCVPGSFPVITGVGCGHQADKIQFPLGRRVEFDFRGSHPVLRYLEDLVILDG